MDKEKEEVKKVDVKMFKTKARVVIDAGNVLLNAIEELQKMNADCDDLEGELNEIAKIDPEVAEIHDEMSLIGQKLGL